MDLFFHNTCEIYNAAEQQIYTRNETTSKAKKCLRKMLLCPLPVHRLMQNRYDLSSGLVFQCCISINLTDNFRAVTNMQACFLLQSVSHPTTALTVGGVFSSSMGVYDTAYSVLYRKVSQCISSSS